MPHNFDSPLLVEPSGRVTVRGPLGESDPHVQVAIWLSQRRDDGSGAFARYHATPSADGSFWLATATDAKTEQFGRFTPGAAIGWGAVVYGDGKAPQPWVEEIELIG